MKPEARPESITARETPTAPATLASPASIVKPTASNDSDTRGQAGALFTYSHLACLHHAETHMHEYLALRGTAQPIVDRAIGSTTTAPFLLNQVLALSALHLAAEAQDVAEDAGYRQQATELQTRALQLFNRAREESCDANSIPAFLFASLLGIHVLQETLASHRDDLSAFIDAFAHYVRLHQGVRTVIANGSWPAILQSDLKPLLYFSELSDDRAGQTPGEDTLKLSEFLREYNAGPESTHACQTALERIQWMLDLSKQDASRDDVGIHATMAWPVLVPPAYIEVLHQHRPEALAVLAFYAAALHRYRHFWVFGGSGLPLLSAILRSIGSFWQDNLGMSVETMLVA
ncbi:hypothetical protein N0V90_005951 [Kalmusia sp. IMI 367209]|nr:hypothetical protein N0V90_005951 [Kalmusia sp. IMI 367209]